MVGHHLHQAFRSWFKETEDDGTPLLPGPLSKKYKVLPTVLGQGSFAVVKMVVEKATGEERALKIIAKKPLKDNSEKMLQEEITILGKVEHPNIIKMWDLYETKEGVFIVTDLCRGGELFDRLVEKVHYNELDARHIMRQVIEAVAYLHSMDIIHRDLKPENILLRDKSDPSDVVISDFGLSRFIPEEGLLMTACGSPQYVSPEVLLGKGYGPAVDMWSSGVIAYALLAGYTPFYGEDQPSLFQQILRMRVEFEPQYWSEVSDTAKDFILRCLCTAEKRMTATEALNHPWLSNLPPVHEEAHRGCCLKNGAQRNLSAMKKLRKAVTAVEAINHLNRLQSLRKQHGQSVPEREKTLLSIVTNIQSHKRGDSLMVTPSDAHPPLDASDSLETVKSSEPATMDQDDKEQQPNSGQDDDQNKKPRGGDSAMALDLTVMMVLMPDSWGSSNPKPEGAASPGTSAVADAVHATMYGQTSEDAHGQDDGDANGTDRPGSPSASSAGQSEATARPSLSQSQSQDQSQQSLSARRQSSQTRRASGSSGKASSASNKTLTTLLDQYKGAEVPRSARLDPAVKTREPTKITFANAWRYVPFLVNQGINIGSALASHAIYGPPKKSWGVEMSVFTRVLRDVGQYSEFASIAGLQQFFDLGAFLPTPKDGLITPVTFRVKKRGLRGFLAESDAAEDGKREISGEWVVGKQTWRRLQSEWRNGKERGKERVILYIHGGAYFVMSAATHRPLTISLSKYTECRVFGINYRLAPDTKFPGALHDCVASFFRLTDDLGIPASNIVLGADSAGGGLALATMMYLRDNGYDMPSGAMLFSPWVDLTLSCDSWETNAEFDYLPMPLSGDHMNPVAAYLGENIDKYLTHPYASPLFGDMHGLPPLLIQCGDAEVLRDEVTLLAHKASLSGVPVRHELYEDCVHVFQAFLFLDASRKALQSARHFVRTALDKRGKKKAEVPRRGVDVEMKSKMSNAAGEKVEPASGEPVEGKGKESEEDVVDGGLSEMVAKAKLEDDGEDEEEQDGGSRADEEDWELHRRTSGDFTPTSSGAATTAASTRTEAEKAVSVSRSSSETSFPPITIEEARLRGQAKMQEQLSTHAPALGKFHAPEKPLMPRVRRTQSGKELSGLLKSFTESGGLTTNVYTPSSGSSG